MSAQSCRGHCVSVACAQVPKESGQRECLEYKLFFSTAPGKKTKEKKIILRNLPETTNLDFGHILRSYHVFGQMLI